MDPFDVEWSREQVEVLQRLHDRAVSSAELNQHLAARLGLPGSDANALGLIIWAEQEGRPLSPADLSRQIGMTSGATTVLLNRLETAGHIRRTRGHADRRRVTLHPEPSARERTGAFLAVAGTEVAEVVLSATAEELRHVTAFVTRVAAAGRRTNARLHGRAARTERGTSPTRSGHSRSSAADAEVLVTRTTSGSAGTGLVLADPRPTSG